MPGLRSRDVDASSIDASSIDAPTLEPSSPGDAGVPFLRNGGKLAQLIHDVGWSPTGLGAIDDWPASRRASSGTARIEVLEGWHEIADFNATVMAVGLAGGTLRYHDQEMTLYRNSRP